MRPEADMNLEQRLEVATRGTVEMCWRSFEKKKNRGPTGGRVLRNVRHILHGMMHIGQGLVCAQDS